MESPESLSVNAKQYKPDPRRLAHIKDQPLIFLVGISGAGKDAIMRRLLASYPADYHYIVSHTTRVPRQNNGVMEQDGVEYHFVDTKRFERMVDAGEFFEINVYANKAYGTSIQEVVTAKKEHKVAISDIDVNGADAYAALDLNVRSIFILPPSYEEWAARLASRGTLPEAEAKLRLQTAVNELKHALEADYYYIVINDDLDKTTHLVHEIAQGATVDRHYPKAMDLAHQLLNRLQQHLAD